MEVVHLPCLVRSTNFTLNFAKKKELFEYFKHDSSHQTLLTWASPAESQLVKRPSNAAELMIYSFFTHSDVSTQFLLINATRQTKFFTSVMRCWSNLAHMIAKWIQIEINDIFIQWTAVLTFSKSDRGESRRWQNVFCHTESLFHPRSKVF